MTPTQHSFPSSDGLTIYGHLTLPSGPGPHPAIVVHTAYLGGALDSRGRYVNTQEHAPLAKELRELRELRELGVVPLVPSVPWVEASRLAGAVGRDCRVLPRAPG